MTSAMVSPAAELDLAVAALQDVGFYYEENAEIGRAWPQEWEDIGTPTGLQFYEENFVNNSVSIVNYHAQPHTKI
jgi:hypothetical protein